MSEGYILTVSLDSLLNTDHEMRYFMLRGGMALTGNNTKQPGLCVIDRTVRFGRL